MPSTPVINTVVTITVKDINNNSVAKVFSNVRYMNLDFYDGTVNIVDAVQGSFYFGIALVTTFTVAITGNQYTIVMS
jgi:hypothetical protein